MNHQPSFARSGLLLAGSAALLLLSYAGVRAAPSPAGTASAVGAKAVKIDREQIIRDLSGAMPPDSYAIRIPAGIMFGTFKKEDGPFLIEGSIIVPSGQALEFGQGSRIYIGGKYTTITVFGQIVIKGTVEEPVLIRSAAARPNPWDWDRIYIRSKNRSVLEHCLIRDCNYGVSIENGSASISYCTFEHNSLYGIVVSNADLNLRNTTLRGGHVLGLLCQAGSAVYADSLVVTGNITGIGCDAKGMLKVNGGLISRNTNGVVLADGSSLAIVAADVTRNRAGIVSTKEIPKNMREMVYENSIDQKVMNSKGIADLFKPPEEVKSIVLPKTRTAVTTSPDFQGGFSAMKAPQEPTTSFIGNVRAGFKYYRPTSLAMNDTLIRQTKYVGEQSTRAFAGIQPELQLFMNGKRGGADVNLLADFYGNEWVPLRKNMFNLSLNFADQTVILGDFYENGSDNSISGRHIVGLKVAGNVFNMGRGTKRVTYNLSAGESEVPKDSGSKQLDLYNQKVDSAMSTRQQITYVAGVNVKPTFNTRVGVRGLIARDQNRNPIFRSPITDPGAPKPTQAQTGCIDGEIDLLDGNLNLSAEVDMGSRDTLDTNDAMAWYDPRIPQSVQKVFGDIPTTENYAYSFDARGAVQGFDLKAGYAQIGPVYATAGNPYLESDRRKATFAVEKQVRENLSVSADYGFEESYLSSNPDTASGPLFRNMVNAEGKYTLGENLPQIALNYSFDLQARQNRTSFTDTATSDSMINSTEDYRKVKNLVGIEGKQKFKFGLDLTLKYQILMTNDYTAYLDPLDLNKEDETQHQITGRIGFKLARLLNNKLSFRVATKRQVKNSLDGLAYKISDQLDFTVIPRRLNLLAKGEYTNKRDRSYDEELAAWKTVVTRYYGGEGEVKLTLTPKISSSVMGRYEFSYDETENSTENYKVVIGGLYLTYLF